MEMRHVNSSDLNAVGYEGGVLYVRFNDGSLYSYQGVSDSVYEGLMAAPSKGRYFHANVNKRYPYQRIG